MTGTQLLTNAVALMGGDTSDTSTYQALALISVNTMLADLFDVNNSQLKANGQPEITPMPTLAQLSDAIPYRDELTRNCMHYGLARDLGVSQQHPNTGYFSDVYDNSKSQYNIATISTVTDAYSESEGN